MEYIENCELTLRVIAIFVFCFVIVYTFKP